MKNMEITSEDEECNTGLCLGLGGHVAKKKKLSVNKHAVVPCLDLKLHQISPKTIKVQFNNNNKACLEERHHQHEYYYPSIIATCSTDSDMDENHRRKKLRLTKEQSSTLETTFNLHNTLNTIQKKALAEQLRLKTRQIEVWFQNRRARTKLKQTEVDYELLKKHCQNLCHENKRLKKELQELKSPLCPQRLSKVCSSCDQKLFKATPIN